MKIAVIDGLGGGLGCQIINSLITIRLPEKTEIIALGTNAGATTRMIEQGADRGATGENAIRVSSSRVDIIVGPLGIIIPNSMLGEVTTAMAEAVADSPAKKFLIGNHQPHVELVGLRDQSLNQLIEDLTNRIGQYLSSV